MKRTTPFILATLAAMVILKAAQPDLPWSLVVIPLLVVGIAGSGYFILLALTSHPRVIASKEPPEAPPLEEMGALEREVYLVLVEHVGAFRPKHEAVMAITKQLTRVVDGKVKERTIEKLRALLEEAASIREERVLIAAEAERLEREADLSAHREIEPAESDTNNPK